MPDTEFTAPEFGTDGLRGRAGIAPMDAETMQRIGAAFGLWLQTFGPEDKRVLLGHDGRSSAEWIGRALTQGLTATDVVTHDVGLIPTPGLAYLTRTETVVGGIMISASHNPATDNGIKIFCADGTKLPDDAEIEIADMTTKVPFEPSSAGFPKLRHELARGYEEHLANLFGTLDLSGMKIVVDAANGAFAKIAPRLLHCFGAEVIEVACEPDGSNINQGVGALHPEHLSEAVRTHGAQFGICLDGDGDRSMFCDEQGSIHDGDSVLALLAPHLQSQQLLPKDCVAATVMSNLGLHKALSGHSIQLHQTAVGDRAVVAAMREHGLNLGGEQSGHVIFGGDGALTGDGMYTALRLLSIPQLREAGAAAAFSGFEKFPQLLINVTVQSKPDLDGITAIQEAKRAVESALGAQGRVVLRYSGTENLCRVMVEGPTSDVVQTHAQAIADAVIQELA